jgi:glycosyltransferase involved in cell wall biosynthesis
VRGAFAHAALATAPSTCPDACPTVVLEAMAHGIPVVTTSIGGMVDMVEDGRTGRLVEPGSARALAEALWDLHVHPGAAAEMGRRAVDGVAAYRAGTVVGRIEGVYRELLDARRGAVPA